MTFPKRMLVYIAVMLFLLNFIVFCVHQNLAPALVLEVSVLEVVITGTFMAFWVPRYNLRW
jgi:hypothetical protein